MINTGLISDKVSRVWRAVRKDTSSRRPFDGEAPTKIALVGARARDSDCRKDERVFGVVGDGEFKLIEGEGGRDGKKGGEDGAPFRWGVLEGWVVPVFLLVVNCLKNDHSVSN